MAKNIKRPPPPRRRPVKSVPATVVQERTTKRVVYASEVCERANIHKVTLWRWIRCGRIKPPGVVGGRNAWTETYITELLENAPTRACYQSMEAA